MTQVVPDTLVSLDRVVMRPLTADDSAAYRRLRQHILDIGEGRFYSTSYTLERQLTSEEQWREWCTETPVRCTIGFFLEGELIGNMGIASYGDPKYRIAEFGSSWIPPRYRSSGLAQRGREKVRAWCREHGYRYAVVDIRADHPRRRESREREGAVYLYTKRNVTWADGSTEDADFLMMSLEPGTETSRSLDEAIGFLEVALAFARQEQHHA